MLALNENLQNHVHSFHAGAIFSLAEATSAQLLINTFKVFENNAIPLLRATNTKYRKLGLTNIYAKGIIINETKEDLISKLNEKKRVLVEIKVDVIDDADCIVFTGIFEWFLSIIK